MRKWTSLAVIGSTAFFLALCAWPAETDRQKDADSIKKQTNHYEASNGIIRKTQSALNKAGNKTSHAVGRALNKSFGFLGKIGRKADNAMGSSGGNTRKKPQHSDK